MPTSDVYVASVKCVSILKRYKPSKHYLYQFKVKWQDKHEETIYRKYTQFYEFHIDLIDMFPAEAGEKGGPRSIPFLPGRKLFRGEDRKLANERKNTLEDYCNDLITLPARLSRSSHVISFFEPTHNDRFLPPDDGKEKSNTLTNMLSKVPKFISKGKKDDDIPVPLKEVEVSGPLPSDVFIALADYKAAARGEVTLAKGQEVEVIEKLENGWWFVVVGGEQGWAPASFLDKGSSSITDELEGEVLENGQKYQVLKEYVGQLEDELTLPEGAIVEVLHKLFDGWWICRYMNRVGFAPATYVTEYFGDGELNASVKIEKKPVKIRNPTQRRCTVKAGLCASRDLTKYRNVGSVRNKQKAPPRDHLPAPQESAEDEVEYEYLDPTDYWPLPVQDDDDADEPDEAPPPPPMLRRQIAEEDEAYYNMGGNEEDDSVYYQAPPLPNQQQEEDDTIYYEAPPPPTSVKQPRPKMELPSAAKCLGVGASSPPNPIPKPPRKIKNAELNYENLQLPTQRNGKTAAGDLSPRPRRQQEGKSSADNTARLPASPKSSRTVVKSPDSAAKPTSAAAKPTSAAAKPAVLKEVRSSPDFSAFPAKMSLIKPAQPAAMKVAYNPDKAKTLGAKITPDKLRHPGLKSWKSADEDYSPASSSPSGVVAKRLQMFENQN